MFALCKPVMPLVQDVVAHTFFEHQHLASVHQQGGLNHVSKEIGKLTEDETDSNTTTGIKTFDSVPLHFLTTIEFHPLDTQVLLLSHSSYVTARLSATSLAIQLPPPRV
ncbi:MAG: hypothetical protein EOP45_19320 [Sphingobacteriaceae bacterium]|nr:MAG: hypothetical protein EOP45_19320 [Sphingobacteriaceae bacterium]